MTKNVAFVGVMLLAVICIFSQTLFAETFEVSSKKKVSAILKGESIKGMRILNACDLADIKLKDIQINQAVLDAFNDAYRDCVEEYKDITCDRDSADAGVIVECLFIQTRRNKIMVENVELHKDLMHLFSECTKLGLSDDSGKRLDTPR